jgi:anion-transporting  ArsA/GET3 family ATPase
VLIPALIIGIFAILAFIIWRRAQLEKQRRRGLLRLLDLADALESLLNQIQKKMQAMQTVVERVPTDIGAVANASLDSAEKIKVVKRDLLQHRLWIQQNGETASQQEIDTACTALERSRDRIAEQLQALEAAGADLAEATASNDQADREPASLRRSE